MKQKMMTFIFIIISLVFSYACSSSYSTPGIKRVEVRQNIGYNSVGIIDKTGYGIGNDIVRNLNYPNSAYGKYIKAYLNRNYGVSALVYITNYSQKIDYRIENRTGYGSSISHYERTYGGGTRPVYRSTTYNQKIHVYTASTSVKVMLKSRNGLNKENYLSANHQATCEPSNYNNSLKAKQIQWSREKLISRIINFFAPIYKMKIVITNMNEAAEGFYNAIKNQSAAVYDYIEADAHRSILRPNHKYYTPLHCAIGHYHAFVAEKMVEKGAPVNVRDRNGITPLRLAYLQLANLRRIARTNEKWKIKHFLSLINTLKRNGAY